MVEIFVGSGFSDNPRANTARLNRALCRDFEPEPSPYTGEAMPNRWGWQTLVMAEADIGKGEEGANNQGKYVWSLTGRKTRGAWCAAAVYTWVACACAYLGVPLKLKRTHSARKLVQRILDAGGADVSFCPLPGDIILFKRGLPWQGHVEVISHVETMGGGLTWDWVMTVGGNVGKFPAKVRCFQRLNNDRVVKIVRLPQI